MLIRASLLAVCAALLNALSAGDAMAEDNRLLSKQSYFGNLSPSEYGELLKDPVNDPKGVDSDGRAALHYAALYGGAPIINLLGKEGVDTNLADAQGNTALHLAVETGKKANILALQRLGVDPDIQNAAGETPLIHLLKNYEDIRSRLRGGEAKGSLWLSVDALMAAHPRLDLKDKSGRTALDYATDLGYSDSFYESALAQGLDPVGTDTTGTVAEPLDLPFQIEGFQQVADRILSGRPFRFDDISQPVTAGAAAWFMENCSTTLSTGDRLELVDFIKAVNVGMIGGTAYADPDIGNAIASQQAYGARYVAGAYGAQAFGCQGEDTSRILEYIRDSIRFNKQGSGGQGGATFVKTCSSRHGEAACNCLLSQGIAIDANLANTPYSADTMFSLSEKNPFVAVLMMAQCGVTDY